MYQLKNVIQMQSVFESKFGDSAAIYEPSFPHKAVLKDMRELLRRKLRVVSGPQYWGEAELLMLESLFQVTAAAATRDRLGQGLVVAKAYQLAAAYSLIANTCAVCEERKIAELLSLSSIKDNPLISNLLAYMGLEISTTKEETGKKGGSKKVFETSNNVAANVWSAIGDIFSNLKLENDELDKTPISALFDALKLPSVDDVDSSVSALFATFVRVLRQGKGLPLTRDQRKETMSKWAAFLTNIDILLQADQKGESAGVDTFADAYTAMFWALEYWKIHDDYEAYFPASSMRLMSSLWMKSISSRCTTMSKFFYKVAITSAGFDLVIARSVIDETLFFYQRLLEKNQSTYTDFIAKWKETSEHITSAVEPFSLSAATQLYEKLKNYVNVKYFLPASYFSELYSSLEAEFDAKSDNNSIELSTTGPQALTALRVTKTMLMIDQSTAIEKLASLAAQGNALADLVHYIEKAQDALRILTVSSGDLWSALVQSPDFDDVLPLEGHIGDIVPADFKLHSPYAVITDKYSVTEASSNTGSLLYSVEWYWTKYLMKPINKMPALKEAATQRADSSRIVWPYTITTPVGDPVTNPYLRVPIPAAYTVTRSSIQTPASITGLLALMAGDSANSLGARDYFLNLATLLARVNIQKDGSLDVDLNPFALPIVNALAGIMQIYTKPAKANDPVGKGWNRMNPSIPTIYGMPTEFMFQKNAVDTKELPLDLDQAHFFASTNERVATITVNGWRFMFVLHKFFPKPGPYVSFMMPFTKATYVACPLLKDIVNSFPELLDLLGTVRANAAVTTTNAAGRPVTTLYVDEVAAKVRGLRWDASYAEKDWWLRSSAYYPTMMLLPHILWDYDDSDTSVSDHYKKLACLQIRTEWDEYRKTTRVAGFWNAPAIILDLEDYQAARAATDPEPRQTADTPEPTDPEPLEAQPKRADAAPVPSPDTLAPEPHLPGSSDTDKEAVIGGIASVTTSPIVAEVKAPAGDGNKAQVVKPAQFEASSTVRGGDGVKDEYPLSGDSKKPDTKEDAGQASSEKENLKFWKKIVDGKVVDVIQASTAPEGYVPATQEEYASFKKGDKSADAADAQPTDAEA